LLVLDEAWTGLDEAARATLDAAVAERVADGGVVLFVDHDPARLAGRADERWQLDGQGRGTVLAGDDGSPARSVSVMEIEVDQPEAAARAQVARLPGVRVRWARSADREAVIENGAAT